MVENHGQEMVKCSHPGCDHKTYTRNNMNKHEKSHNLLPQFQCKYCAKMIKRKLDLVAHEAKHEGKVGPTSPLLWAVKIQCSSRDKFGQISRYLAAQDPFNVHSIQTTRLEFVWFPGLINQVNRPSESNVAAFHNWVSEHSVASPSILTWHNHKYPRSVWCDDPIVHSPPKETQHLVQDLPWPQTGVSNPMESKSKRVVSRFWAIYR